MSFNILIIGAGVAGLNAGYFLTSQGFDNYTILEASDTVGGRIQALTDFADDLALDLGQVSVFLGAESLRDRLLYPEDVATYDQDYELIDFDPEDYEFCQIDGSSGERRLGTLWSMIRRHLCRIFPDMCEDEDENVDEDEDEAEYDDGDEDEDDDEDEDEDDDEGEDEDDNEDEDGDEDDDGNEDKNQCFPDSIDEDISKFNGKTFSSYFENFIIPYVEDKILLNTVVTSIDYRSSDKVVVTMSNSDQLAADRVIIATPSTVLRDEDIQFIPPLPDEYRSALNAVSLSSLVRVWLEFSVRFYPSGFLVAGEESDTLFFDAAFDQDTSRNILTVIQPFEGNDEEIVFFLLNELDTIFENQASASLVKSRVQNWPNKQFIKGAIPFLTEEAEENEATAILATPIDKIYFAGDYIDAEGHYYDPTLSGQTAAEQVLNGLPLRN